MTVTADAPPRSNLRVRPALFASGLLLSTLTVVWLRTGTSLPREAALMGGIFVLAAALWATEALPLFATGLLVIGLEVVLLANPGGWPGLGFAGPVSPSYQAIIAVVADPVLLLFFGGFLLARAAVKEGVDAAMAGLVLRPFGSRPAIVLLGVMLVTGLFSMWMSNTATAAMMIALVGPMLRELPPGERFRKALVLAVAFAANIGGMGTPIGSPPNAVAVGFLREAGHPITFVQWMLMAVPLMLGLLVLTWGLLWLTHGARDPSLRLATTRQPLRGRGVYVVIVFIATVGLWLAEPLHGLPASVVALLPAIAFTATGILGAGDVDRLEWNVLILIAGGIALGVGMQLTGLDRAIVAAIAAPGDIGAGLGVRMILLIVGATLLLSTFMSNTAAANLLLPVGVSLASVASSSPPGEVSGAGVRIAVAIALTASVGMALPISTPPNAIAYARGEITARDMIVPGAVIGIIAALLVGLFGGVVLRFWGFE